jgi:chromosome segregation ATPase
MWSQLSLSVIEIIVLMLGAIVLGFTIHFFVFSRRSWREMNETLKNKTNPSSATNTSANELATWKSKFFDETELKSRMVDELKKQLAETEENLEIYTIEAEETKIQNKKLKAELEELKMNPPQTEKQDYISEIKKAEKGLHEQNERISKLLGQIDVVKESEYKNTAIQEQNEELVLKIEGLTAKLSQKEKEIAGLKQKENLTKEMASMLDNAYTEFDILQEKIKVLENQVTASKKANMDYTDVKDDYNKLVKDFEDQKLKYQGVVLENREVKSSLNEMEDKFKEAEYQRLQLQKKAAFLENLNTDMQSIADAHKKLETQIKKMGELESKLNIVSEERDNLIQQKLKSV